MRRMMILMALLIVGGAWMLTDAVVPLAKTDAAATQPAAQNNNAPTDDQADASSEPPAPDEPGHFAQWWEEFTTTGLLGFYTTGGRFMIPLMLCQIIGLGVIIERFGSYRSIRIDSTQFRGRVQKLIQAGKTDDAIKLCDATPGPIAATLATGLRRFKLLRKLGRPADQTEAEVTRAIDDYGIHVLAVLERHLPILGTLAVVAPLFGFLGTVDGMVTAFGDIEAAAGAGNIIQVAAAGIRVALFTTVLGLCIGIVAQLAYNHFTARVNEMVLEVEESASELMHNLAVVAVMGGEATASTPAQAAPPTPAAAGKGA